MPGSESAVAIFVLCWAHQFCFSFCPRKSSWSSHKALRVALFQQGILAPFEFDALVQTPCYCGYRFDLQMHIREFRGRGGKSNLLVSCEVSKGWLEKPKRLRCEFWWRHSQTIHFFLDPSSEKKDWGVLWHSFSREHWNQQLFGWHPFLHRRVWIQPWVEDPVQHRK